MAGFRPSRVGAKAYKLILVTHPISKDRQTILHFDESEGLRNMNEARHTADGQTGAVGYDDSLTSPGPRLRQSAFDVQQLFRPPLQRPDFEMREPSGNISAEMIRPAKVDLLNLENVTSSNENTFPRSMGPWGYPPGNTPVRSIPKSVTKEHYELYLDHFHHRWPVVHIPSFEKEDVPYLLTASVEMIGAWLQGSCESKSVALTLHDRLTNHILNRMVNPFPIKLKIVAYM